LAAAKCNFGINDLEGLYEEIYKKLESIDFSRSIYYLKKLPRR
jgi:hypothetical protein